MLNFDMSDNELNYFPVKSGVPTSRPLVVALTAEGPSKRELVATTSLLAGERTILWSSVVWRLLLSSHRHFKHPWLAHQQVAAGRIQSEE